MSDADGSKALLCALRRLLPNAVFAITHQRPWHSLTFAGTALCLSACIRGKRNQDAAGQFAKLLPAHEFALPNQLVADIALAECAHADGESRLTIHALLLTV